MLHIKTVTPHLGQDYPRSLPRALAIGSFDGVHLGHQAIIRTLTKQAQSLGLRSCVLMLEPQPREYFYRIQNADPFLAPARITPLLDKISALSELGIDEVAVLHFRANVAKLSASSFIEEIVVHRLNARWVMTGADFRFGQNARGNTAMLAELSHQYDFDFVTMPQVGDEQGVRYASTRIREWLSASEFDRVRAALGRDYQLSARVQSGLGLAGRWGIPTANLYFREKLALSGVFVGNAKIFPNTLNPNIPQKFIDNWQPALIHLGQPHLGFAPPINARRLEKLEVHLLGFPYLPLYGMRIAVRFLKKLRDSTAFPNEESLKAQMNDDVGQAKRHHGL